MIVHCGRFSESETVMTDARASVRAGIPGTATMVARTVPHRTLSDTSGQTVRGGGSGSTDGEAFTLLAGTVMEVRVVAGRQVTLAEIAKVAGVSLATASRVLNGSARRVSESLQEQVLATAQRLGYLPNASAQALARSTTSLLGLIVHDITDPYFSSIAAGVTRVAEQSGLVVVLGTTNRQEQRELELLSTLHAHRARAVVLAGSRTTSRNSTQRLSTEIEAFTRQGGRVACISQPKLPADTVAPNNKQGATSLAREMLALGHRRFAVLAGPQQLLSARDRFAGFRTGLSQAGVPLGADDIVHGPFTRDGGYTATVELLRRRSNATCVFAVNDVMAVGALAALREHGISVPDQLSLAGFDDITTLRDFVPALTTVRLPLEQIGEQATRLALDDEIGDTPRTLPIDAEVILRDSTTTPPDHP
jgi:LacI family transcriptional regulator